MPQKSYLVGEAPLPSRNTHPVFLGYLPNTARRVIQGCESRRKVILGILAGLDCDPIKHNVLGVEGRLVDDQLVFLGGMVVAVVRRCLIEGQVSLSERLHTTVYSPRCHLRWIASVVVSLRAESAHSG